MRRLAYLFLLFLNLCAQSDLPQRLQRLPRLPLVALQSLKEDLAKAPETPHKTYWEALVDYHMVWKLRGKAPHGAKAMLEAAIQRLEPAQDPDAKALRGACMDLMIGFNRAMAMVLAPRAARLIQEAQQAAPKNPRVKVFWGIHCVHIPALFGGGSARAITTLSEAIKDAEAEMDPGDPFLPQWGRIEAMAWLAEAQSGDGNKAEAKRTIAQALALDPGYPFAKAVQRELQ